MAVLTTKKRASLSSAQFALPAQKKYPIPDKVHAANAKARASGQYNKGNISASTKKKIFAAANGKLRGK